MRELSLACIGFVLEFIVFYAAGSLLVRALKIKTDSSLTFILGYLVYFAVFEIVTVPMTLKRVSLTNAAYIWTGVMGLAVLTALILAVKSKAKRRSGMHLQEIMNRSVYRQKAQELQSVSLTYGRIIQ